MNGDLDSEEDEDEEEEDEDEGGGNFDQHFKMFRSVASLS